MPVPHTPSWCMSPKRLENVQLQNRFSTSNYLWGMSLGILGNLAVFYCALSDYFSVPKVLGLWANEEPSPLSLFKRFDGAGGHLVTPLSGRGKPHLLSCPLLWCPVGDGSAREKFYHSKGGGRVLESSASPGGSLASILEENPSTWKETLSIVTSTW